MESRLGEGTLSTEHSSSTRIVSENGNFCIKKSPCLCQLWLVWGADLLWSTVEGCKGSFERSIHIVEQQMTFLQYFFVKQTILCLEFGICVLVKHCKSESLPLCLRVYHPLVNDYELLCDCFCLFVLGCLV